MAFWPGCWVHVRVVDGSVGGRVEPEPPFAGSARGFGVCGHGDGIRGQVWVGMCVWMLVPYPADFVGRAGAVDVVAVLAAGAGPEERPAEGFGEV